MVKIVKNNKKNLLVISLVLSIVANGILLVNSYKNSKILSSESNFEAQVKKYPLLSKRILKDFPQDILINFLDLRKALKAQTEPYGDSFGFYFEYLPTGTSIGVNEKNEFYAASLFKVPVTMAYYKYLERTNSTEDLNKEITVEMDDVDSQFGDLWQQGVGTKIKMSEAIRLALEKSDNTAARVIAKRVIEEDFESVYQALDIDLETASGGAILTPKSYTSILKALYFSAVLNKEDSNDILNYLSHSDFNDKLVAGVPKDQMVSHKIGEYRDKDGETAYMDCGIVYVPRRPYTLCMISTGDENTAKERMKLLSKTVYDYVTSK